MEPTQTIKLAKVKADGINVFYREAGSPSKPHLVLLHGHPTSSHQFRNLLPLLANDYHVIAPDYPGYGFTEVPADRSYEYTFENLTKTVLAFLDAMSIDRFAVYMFDFGAPITFRIALEAPSRILAIISQNGNTYKEGIGMDFFAPIISFWQTNDREATRAGAITFAWNKAHYLDGLPEQFLSSVAPETYTLDSALQAQPGVGDAHLDLLYNYQTNVALYPQFQKYLQDSQVPLLAVWGKHDPAFIAAGAMAYKQHLPEARVELLDTGHFALETHVDEIAKLSLQFLSGVLKTGR